MPKLVLGSQILQDTFENLKQQGSDVVSGLKDLVAGDSQNSDTKADSGIEQLAGQQDPKQQLQQIGATGLTPQQLMEKRTREEQDRQFHQDKIKEWESHFLQVEAQKKEEKNHQAAQKEQEEDQEIIQLREEQARAQTLQGSPKSKQGKGTAFLPQSAKQSMGTGELSKTPTN